MNISIYLGYVAFFVIFVSTYQNQIQMKKAIFLLAAVFVCMALFSQQQIIPNPGLKTVNAPEYQIQESALQNQAAHISKTLKPVPPKKGIDFVNVIDVGTSSNGFSYGFDGGQRTFLWADQDLNTIMHFHRMGGGLDPNGYSGDLGYDISKDGGLTWENQIECFIAQPAGPGIYCLEAARYPNAAIYNPPGNQNPDEAYVEFFAPMLNCYSNSGPLWGYYMHGRANIGDQTDTTRNLISWSPNDSLVFNTPKGFTITRLGDVWASDFSIWQDMSGDEGTYLGDVITSHGIWNAGIDDFEYTINSLELPTVINQIPLDNKIAFSPDGNIGWIAVITDGGSVPISTDRSFYPILWKTTDAGQIWEGPISVAIAGENGIDGVKDFLSDEELEELYAYVPDRNAIEFTTAYDFDLHVDFWGNPHIAVVVGITGAEPYSIVSAQSPTTGNTFIAPFDLTLDNNGNWKGFELGRMKTFRGTFEEVTEDNRIQIASSWDGIFMFVTWNDTDLPGVEENNQPNIYCRGLELMNGTLTGNNGQDMPYNVTEFSEGMWQAYFHNLSHYVLLDDWQFTIPLSYQEMNPEVLTDPVQYKYITDFKIDAIGVGLDETNLKYERGILVSGPNPNPSSSTATININIFDSRILEIAVHNLTGQKVLSLPTISYQPGSHPISIDVSGFGSGVYVLTVSSEGNQVSRKLVVE